MVFEHAAARGWRAALAMVPALVLVTCATPSKRPTVPSPEPVLLPVNPGDNASPRVASDGAGNWVAVWHSAKTDEDDFDILVARSTDDGTTWTAPVPLASNADADAGHDFHPQIATDAAGRWLAVWQSEDTLGGTIGADADLLVSRSADAGLTWSVPVPLNANAAADSGDDLRPYLATDRRGLWLVVWHDEDPMGGPSGKDADILAARSTDGGLTWTAPEPVNSDAASDRRADGFPHAATDGAGGWIVVWSAEEVAGGPHGHDGDVLLARSADDGATWTAPAALNTNAAGDIGSDMYPQIATDARGLWVAVWQSYDSLGNTIGEDADVLLARSHDRGATWSPPTPIDPLAGTDADYDMNPRIATDGRGRWVVGWVLDDSWGTRPATDIDLLVSHSTDDTLTWTPPVALNPSAASDAGQDDSLDLVTDSRGRWLALWRSNVALDGTPGPTFNILIARSADGGATWAVPAAHE